MAQHQRAGHDVLRRDIVAKIDDRAFGLIPAMTLS
jgi:hypothetical protein